MNHNCEIFTPPKIVDEMLDSIKYSNDIFDRKIADFACGDGNILVKVVERYIKAARTGGKNDEQIISGLENCIYGVEIKDDLVFKCKQRLTDAAAGFGIKNVNWRVVKDDGLKYKFNCEFDYIALNPPYIAYTVLPEEDRIFVKNNFKTCLQGKFDYSYAFIERGIELLKDRGLMVCITPSNYFKTQFGKNLREFVLPYLTKIIDYSRVKVFKQVLTSPAISVFNKIEQASFVYNDKSKKTKKTMRKNQLGDKWSFNKIENVGEKRFGDYFKVSNSVATLANAVFVITEETVATFGIEIDILRNTMSPKTKAFHRNVFILFPYKYEKGLLKKIGEQNLKEKYPCAYKYLESKKEKLKKRKSDKSCEWFEYGRSQALTYLNQEKIMISSILTKEIRVYSLEKEDVPYSGFYIISRGKMQLKQAEEILKSKAMIDHLNNVGIPVSGESVRISTKDIEDFRF